MKKKVLVLTLMLLTLGTYATATCNIDILDEFVPPFYLGTAGSVSLTACCGTPGYTFTLYSGSLPPGLSLSSSGTISGTPTTTGYWTACIRVTDSVGCHVTRCYEIYVE